MYCVCYACIVSVGACTCRCTCKCDNVYSCMDTCTCMCSSAHSCGCVADGGDAMAAFLSTTIGPIGLQLTSLAHKLELPCWFLEGSGQLLF